MLTTCEHCNQIIKIADYNDHKLRVCEKKGEIRKCPRCHDPLHVSEYKDHTEEMSCLPIKNPKLANRCPLCKLDIPPGEMGWKQHLLS